MKWVNFSLFLLMLLCSNTVFAIDYWNKEAYNFETIPYVSVDNENNPAVLSVSIMYPTVSENDKTPAQVKFIVLNNHPTVTANYEAPSGSEPIDLGAYIDHGLMRLMTTEGAMVISCDYLGYGYSSDKIHPYCIPDLTARNVVDGFVAAIDTARARGIEFADDYYTLNEGYSQGGAVTMAVQKYLETTASLEVRDLVRLKKSICGAGPYDLVATYKDLGEGESLAYPCSLPMCAEGLNAAFKEGCMKQVDLDSIYLSRDFRLAMEEKLQEKMTGDEDLVTWIQNYFGKSDVKASDMFRPEMLNHTSETAHELDKALSKCNLLDGTWIPETPITIFQYTQDEIVPYINSEEAKEVFGDKVTLYNENSGLKVSNPMLQMLLNLATPVINSHETYAVLFWAYFLDGVIR